MGVCMAIVTLSLNEWNFLSKKIMVLLGQSQLFIIRSDLVIMLTPLQFNRKLHTN